MERENEKNERIEEQEAVNIGKRWCSTLCNIIVITTFWLCQKLFYENSVRLGLPCCCVEAVFNDSQNKFGYGSFHVWHSTTTATMIYGRRCHWNADWW